MKTYIIYIIISFAVAFIYRAYQKAMISRSDKWRNSEFAIWLKIVGGFWATLITTFALLVYFFEGGL